MNNKARENNNKVLDKEGFESSYTDLLELREKLRSFLLTDKNLEIGETEKLNEIINRIDELEKIQEKNKSKSITKQATNLIKNIYRSLKKVIEIIKMIDSKAENFNNGVKEINLVINKISERIGKIIF
ncbi:MAG: hypothetical protein PHN31_00735 [Candidatus Gracilibacteria bacterium]|nr:hypothetical protein [Candidatus Gracilibacteria bacterium]